MYESKEQRENFSNIDWLSVGTKEKTERIRHLLRERRIGPLRVRSGVLGWLLLRIIGVIGPGLGTMGSAVMACAVNVLVRVSLRRAGPGRVFLVAGPIADAFEAGRVSDRRRWRWRRFVSLVEREREAIKSEALAVPVPTKKNPLVALYQPLSRIHKNSIISAHENNCPQGSGRKKEKSPARTLHIRYDIHDRGFFAEKVRLIGYTLLFEVITRECPGNQLAFFVRCFQCPARSWRTS